MLSLAGNRLQTMANQLCWVRGVGVWLLYSESIGDVSRTNVFCVYVGCSGNWVEDRLTVPRPRKTQIPPYGCPLSKVCHNFLRPFLGI
jgi:hypothetical protein